MYLAVCIFQRLELKNNTQTYKYWQQLPVPLNMSIYLFNWTNPEATIKNGDKPIVQQLGPYVFKYEQLILVYYIFVLQ